MQENINSSNITTLKVGVEFDIYNRKVTFNTASTVYAGSSGSGIFNVLGISFLLEDKQGITLASIDFDTPGKYIVPSADQEFDIDLSSLSFPFLFQTYKMQAAIKDADGTIYYTEQVYKTICQPTSINEGGYVNGIFQVIPNCVDNVLTVKELTPFIYNNKTADSVTKSGTLYYPTGTISNISFTGTPFSNNQIYSGQYRINCTSVGSYDMGDDVTVLVTYLTNNYFDVTCANRIADLICCMVKLQDTYLKNCENATGKNAKQQLDEISIPFLLGLTKEINGQDASDEATLIKKTLKCDCGSSSVLQNEFTPINPAVNSIVLTGIGGTTIPAPTINGNTKTYNIASNVYQVTKGNTGDLAFTIEVDNSTQYYVKYKITFNYSVLAQTILTTIQNNTTLKNQLNSLITVSASVSLVGLDGKCVIDLDTCDYTLLQTFNSDSTLVKSIIINGNTYNAPGSGVLIADPASIQVWLNGLGLGTWAVYYNANLVPPGGVIMIQSSGNTNTIGTVQFEINGNQNVSHVFASTCKTLIQVLQAIIDYLCGLTDLQVSLSNTITLWQIDYNGVPISSSYTDQEKQSTLNQAVADSIYNIVQWISNLTGVTCTKIKAVFSDSPNSTFGASGRLYGTDGDACVSFTDKQIAKLVIAAVGKYSDVKEEWCAIDCSSAGTCPDIAKIVVAMVGANIGVYSVEWTQTPSATQTVSLYYKQSAQTNYTLATNNLLILPNGNVQVNPPYQILGAVGGVTYDIKIVNNCGGSGFVTQITTPGGTIYSGSYLRDSILYNVCAGASVTLYTTVPFGVGAIVYTDAGATIPLTGYSYIADATGEIYTIDPATGEVLADTGTSCNNGVEGTILLGNNTGTICDMSNVATGYTNGAFAPGATLYSDASLTTPITGYSYVVNPANDQIYNLNPATGLIGVATGLSCGSYAGYYKTDNLEATICLVPDIIRYSADPFAPGVTMYTDAALTTLLTGFQYIADSSGTIYNLNAVTGVVGTVTGGSCAP